MSWPNNQMGMNQVGGNNGGGGFQGGYSPNYPQPHQFENNQSQNWNQGNQQGFNYPTFQNTIHQQGNPDHQYRTNSSQQNMPQHASYQMMTIKNYSLQAEIDSLKEQNRKVTLNQKQFEQQYDQIVQQLQKKIKALEEKIGIFQAEVYQSERKISEYKEQYIKLLNLSKDVTERYEHKLIEYSDRHQLISKQFEIIKGELERLAQFRNKQKTLNDTFIQYNSKLDHLKGLTKKCQQIINIQVSEAYVGSKCNKERLDLFLRQNYEMMNENQVKVSIDMERELARRVTKGIGLNLTFLLEEFKVNLNTQNNQKAYEVFQNIQNLITYLVTSM